MKLGLLLYKNLFCSVQIILIKDQTTLIMHTGKHTLLNDPERKNFRGRLSKLPLQLIYADFFSSSSFFPAHTGSLCDRYALSLFFSSLWSQHRCICLFVASSLLTICSLKVQNDFKLANFTGSLWL